jgi:alkyl sulfatase BDS1-like metallo-beta-lactamase superfamily hydrolase
MERKDATNATKLCNNSFAREHELDLADTRDYQDARKGFVVSLQNPVIADRDGRTLIDANAFSFLDSETAAETVNPSLWRQARLNAYHGLYQVTENIYQVRGYDIANFTVVAGKSGYVVIDPVTSTETAEACFQLIQQHLGRRQVRAVIYTHSHIDHWAGVKAVVTEDDVLSGKVKIIAPAGFMDTTVREYVIAGNVMKRRADYMFAKQLPTDARGNVDTGLGKNDPVGNVTLIRPTDSICKTGEYLEIDGIGIVFQLTPNTEAPVEMNLYFPRTKALCMAENCTHTMHNLYTIRGAEVRDARSWATHIDEAIEMFGKDVSVVFASHHWPVWGQARVAEYLKQQRDLYLYIHDQTLRLANHGYTMMEIADMIRLPRAMASQWHTRGYYGTLSHNARAVYQKYIGFYDGNPANLNPLPPEESARKYVDFMGGAQQVVEKARIAFDNGEYRWVAQVLNHVIFAQPDNVEAVMLQADTLEQLGYQTESATWRNAYLTGANELRNGVEKNVSTRSVSMDLIKAMDVAHFFDLLAVRLNGLKADGKTISLNFEFRDETDPCQLFVENSVLHHAPGKASHATLTLTLRERKFLMELFEDGDTARRLIAAGDVEIDGCEKELFEFIDLLDTFPFKFNIVTP